mmetsp:Transcript_6936/g.30337  ORF Transcript_6936/g.30337 Transcript_6936/m.30337 type:complete len:176 (+) Transcript_6936:106-633(+)
MGQGTVKLTDLNDFLRPSDACILPVGGGMQAKSEPKPGSFASPMYGKQSEEQAKIARVTLSDCITCSGCVTSAETILLDSTEALRAFESGCSDKSRFAVVGLSQQAVASVAEKYGLGLVATYEKLCTILKELGASRVTVHQLQAHRDGNTRNSTTSFSGIRRVSSEKNLLVGAFS